MTALALHTIGPDDVAWAERVGGRWRARFYNADWVDWEAEACMALCLAARRYDPRHASHASFRTYASYFIRREFGRRINKHLHGTSHSAKRARGKTRLSMPVALTADGAVLSTLCVREDRRNGSFVPRALQHDPSADIDRCDASADLRGWDRGLDVRERQIMLEVAREEGSNVTAARMLGISRERVRQLRERATAKARANLTGGSHATNDTQPMDCAQGERYQALHGCIRGSSATRASAGIARPAAACEV